MSAVGISVHKASFAYAKTPILDQLSLKVEAGEIVALLGASGCGKSTLLKAIANLVQPQAGSIHFGDDSPMRRSDDLSFVFQDANLLPWRTVLQNVCLPLELGRKTRRDRRNREVAEQPSRKVQLAEAALREVELPEESFAKFPSELSGGMRMRTSIARALITDPSVMLLDEPFAALDDLLRTRLNELLLRLWSTRKRTIVFVTHNIAEAVFLSHRIAILANGRIASILENQLFWPRNAEQRTSSEFASVYSSISQALAEASK